MNSTLDKLKQMHELLLDIGSHSLPPFTEKKWDNYRLELVNKALAILSSIMEAVKTPCEIELSGEIEKALLRAIQCGALIMRPAHTEVQGAALAILYSYASVLIDEKEKP